MSKQSSKPVIKLLNILEIDFSKKEQKIKR